MPESRIGEFITVVRDGPIATVTWARGDGRNALSLQLMREMIETARGFENDLETQVIILTGTGAFTAGADLKDRSLVRSAAPSLLERRQMVKVGPDLCAAWENLEQVTICAIEKYAIGGGSALVAACDFRIMGQGAHMRLPEIPLGMNMSWQSVPRLVSLIGPSRTKQFVIFGERVEAAQALAWGLADEVVPDGEALAAARRWAKKVAKLPPIAVRMSKQGVNGAANALHQATSFMDRDQYALATSSEDYREAVLAWLEKREPKFTGR